MMVATGIFEESMKAGDQARKGWEKTKAKTKAKQSGS